METTPLLQTVANCLAVALLAGCSSPNAGEGAAEGDAKRSLATATACTHTSGDELLPYEPVTGLAGNILSIGASTTTNLVARAAAEFRRIYPDVTVQATAELTSIGPSAFSKNRADIVPMSRELSPEEISDFAKAFGYPPTEIRVAADALAIYVEKNNPIAGLTLQDLDGIFSRTRRRGGPSIERWGQLGLTGDWADLPISLYGYGPGDAAHLIFRQRVLAGGEYRLSLRVHPGGGSAIVQSVATEAGAIGCASVFFACQAVRAVPIAGTDGHFYQPTTESVRARLYPLSRYLYVCVNKPPRRPLGGPAAEFLRFLLSREGQEIVAADRNIPLDASTAELGRRALEE